MEKIPAVLCQGVSETQHQTFHLSQHEVSPCLLTKIPEDQLPWDSNSLNDNSLFVVSQGARRAGV